MRTIVIMGQEIRMELRRCVNCAKAFEVNAESDQTTCSTYCGPDGVHGMPKAARDRQAKIAAGQRHRARVERVAKANAKVKSHIAEAVPVKLAVVKAPVDHADAVLPSESDVIAQRWESYVDRARKIVKSIGHQRLEIAELAIAACDIRHSGGDHWSKHEKVHTLKAFAGEIGISYKTLHNWVRIATLVKPNVEADQWDDRDWGAASRTVNRISKKTSKSDISARYIKEKAKTHDVGLQFHTLVKKMSNARHFLRTVKLEKLDREDLERMLELSDEVGTRIRTYLAGTGD